MAWWKLTIIGKENLTEEDIDHISKLIAEGYIEGDLTDDDEDGDE